MSLPIHVDAYSGYKANERPRDFTVDQDLYEIAEVEDRWYEPDAMYFRVRTSEGKRYILRYASGALRSNLFIPVVATMLPLASVCGVKH